MQFTELSLCDTLQEGLEAMNFTETTPVQELAIPVILAKKDVIACAQTGTGKTAAFLLPLLNNLQTEPHDKSKVNAIIMAPTRELAQQIDQQMEGFSYFTPFSSVAVYGGNDGEAWEVQKRGLLSGADVVIATPGRLLSHINLYNIDFSGVKYFILDEADRMLDMGFFDDIMKIEKLLPKERQTVMFSATMPPKIQQLAKTILRDPEEIAIAISRPPETILQSAYICTDAQKMGILKQLFKEKKPNKVILFSGSKQKVKEIARTLHKMGLSAGEMHSDLDQAQRNHVMHEFKNERVDILVATDIVARGIDIDDITLVINYDVPYDAEDYVHRIGRTARAGDTGMAITFVSPSEQYRFSLIEKFLQKEIYRIPVPAELGEAPEYNPTRESAKRGASGRGSKGGRKKEGRRSEGAEKPQKQRETRSKRPMEGEHPESRKKRTPRNPEVTGEQQNIAETPVDNSTQQENQERKPRKKRGQKASGERRASGRETLPERQERRTSPERETTEERQGRQTSPEKEGKKGREGKKNKQNEPGQQQAPREQSRPKSRRNSEGAETGNTKKKVLVKKNAAKQTSNQTVVPQPNVATTGKAEKPASEKKRKWSWWPFGKK